MQDVGFYPVTAKMYILQDMMLFNMFIVIFSLIFDVVLLIFIVISILLIYSLLMIGVETKTFETGIMRMVGVTKNGLIYMVVVQGIMFVLPSIIVGFILCFPAIAACYHYGFHETLDHGFEPIPHTQAVIAGLIVGLMIPLISSIIPIYKVLGQNLNDALNY